MMGRTHCLVPAALAAWLFGPDPTILLISAGTGLLPDIDEPQSTIGYRLFLLAKGFKGLVGHRTYSHSLVGIVTAAALAVIFDLPWIWIEAGLIGWVSHLVLDALSGGVPLWWPLYATNRERWVLARWKPFGFADHLILVLAGVAFGAAAIHGNWLGWWIELLKRDINVSQ